MQYGKWKTMLRNLSYVLHLNITPMEKAWFRLQWNIPLWFIAYMTADKKIYPKRYNINQKVL